MSSTLSSLPSWISILSSLWLFTQSPYFSPVQSLMLYIHIILGLPCPLFPSIFLQVIIFVYPFCLIKCLKYWSFLFLLSLSVIFWRLSFLGLLHYFCPQSMVSSLFFSISTFQMLLVCFELPLSLSMFLSHKDNIDHM